MRLDYWKRQLRRAAVGASDPEIVRLTIPLSLRHYYEWVLLPVNETRRDGGDRMARMADE
jgi:hypothetical protein